MFAKILSAIAVVLVVTACTTTRVTQGAGQFDDSKMSSTLLPGYEPDVLESLSLLASRTDMAQPGPFLAAACNNSEELNTDADDLDANLHTPSRIWAISLTSGGNSPATQPSNTNGTGNSPTSPANANANNGATTPGTPGNAAQGGGGSPTPASSPAKGTDGSPVAAAVGNAVTGAANLASTAVNTVLGGASPSSTANTSSAPSSGYGFTPSLVLASGTKLTTDTVSAGPVLPPNTQLFQLVADGKGISPGGNGYSTTYGPASVNGQTQALFQEVTDSTGKAPGTAGYTATYAPVTTAETKTISTTAPGGLLDITQCSLKVLRAAVNICIFRSSSRSTANEVLNNVLGSGLAVGGAAAGIAALSRASGKATTVIGGAGVLGSGLFGAFQKEVPASAGQSQASSVVASGLQYLVLDETLTQLYDAPQFDQISQASVDKKGQVLQRYQDSYAHLFDAAMQGCTVADD